MAARGERGAAKVLEKLEAALNTENYYEAHQMYRTLYFRYLNKKKYEELLNLLYKGSTLLLGCDQQHSGSDLALLYIEVLIKAEKKADDELAEKIVKLFESMPATMPEREQFLTNAIKWSMDENKKGYPYLHKKIAEVYWKEKKFPEAHRHFLRSNDGVTYASMLIDMHTSKGYKTEMDMFIAQSALRVLCFKNLQMALDAFHKYTSAHPKIKNETQKPPYPTPLLNFLWFLLEAIKENNSTQFLLLRKIYATSIKRDQFYNEYLDTIGHVWFQIETRKQVRSTGLFGGLLRTLMGEASALGSDDEDDTLTVRAPEVD